MDDIRDSVDRLRKTVEDHRKETYSQLRTVESKLDSLRTHVDARLSSQDECINDVKQFVVGGTLQSEDTSLRARVHSLESQSHALWLWLRAVGSIALATFAAAIKALFDWFKKNQS